MKLDDILLLTFNVSCQQNAIFKNCFSLFACLISTNRHLNLPLLLEYFSWKYFQQDHNYKLENYLLYINSAQLNLNWIERFKLSWNYLTIRIVLLALHRMQISEITPNLKRTNMPSMSFACHSFCLAMCRVTCRGIRHLCRIAFHFIVSFIIRRNRIQRMRLSPVRYLDPEIVEVSPLGINSIFPFIYKSMIYIFELIYAKI